MYLWFGGRWREDGDNLVGRLDETKVSIDFSEFCIVHLDFHKWFQFLLLSVFIYYILCCVTQEERQRTNKERDQNEVESTSTMITEEVSIHRILEAESLSLPELTDDVKVSTYILPQTLGCMVLDIRVYWNSYNQCRKLDDSNFLS